MRAGQIGITPKYSCTSPDRLEAGSSRLVLQRQSGFSFPGLNRRTVRCNKSAGTWPAPLRRVLALGHARTATLTGQQAMENDCPLSGGSGFFLLPFFPRRRSKHEGLGTYRPFLWGGSFLFLSLFLFYGSQLRAQLPDKFFQALRQVETGGEPHGGQFTVADQGRSFGPFCISKAYWLDSRVPGSYGMVTNRIYAERVVRAYFARYCPAALRAGNMETCARVHNGGWNGMNNPATRDYWRKVRLELN